MVAHRRARMRATDDGCSDGDELGYRIRVGDALEDLRGLMPLLEAGPADALINEDTAARLVEFALSPGWSEYWVGKALNWIDEGVTSDAVVEALKRVSQDKRLGQATRHRAWRHVKSRWPW